MPTLAASDIVRAAIDDEMPEAMMSPADRALYYHIQVINLKLLLKKIIKPMATAEKISALQEHTADRAKCESGTSAMMRIADLYKRLELAASAYRKERTLENADKLLLAIDGVDMRKGKNV